MALRVVKFDRVGDLCVEKLIRILLGLHQLLEVVVEGVSQLSVLALAAELVAEREEVLGDAIVEVEQLGVLAQSVHDHFGYARVEIDPWNQSILVDNILELTVGEEDELLRRSVNLLGHVGLLSRISSLGSRLTLAQDLGQLLNAIGLLDLANDAVALLNQVTNDLLKQAHARVLARVPKVVQVIFELLGGRVGHANVDQTRL